MGEVSGLYDDAIAALEQVSADFKTSDEARDAANAQVAALRARAQDAALDDLAARTANLNALSSTLSSVLDKTEGGGGGPLQALADRVKKALAG